LGGISEVVKNPDHPAITLLVSPGSKKHLPKIIRPLEWDIFFILQIVVYSAVAPFIFFLWFPPLQTAPLVVVGTSLRPWALLE